MEDKKWLQSTGIDADEIAGPIPMSGQAITTLRFVRNVGLMKNNL